MHIGTLRLRIQQWPNFRHSRNISWVNTVLVTQLWCTQFCPGPSQHISRPPIHIWCHNHLGSPCPPYRIPRYVPRWNSGLVSSCNIFSCVLGTVFFVRIWGRGSKITKNTSNQGGWLVAAAAVFFFTSASEGDSVRLRFTLFLFWVDPRGVVCFCFLALWCELVLFSSGMDSECKISMQIQRTRIVYWLTSNTVCTSPYIILSEINIILAGAYVGR